MKAILEFDLNDHDDRRAHLRCVKSTDMALAIWNIVYEIRKSTERKLESQETSTDAEFNFFFDQCQNIIIILYLSYPYLSYPCKTKTNKKQKQIKNKNK